MSDKTAKSEPGKFKITLDQNQLRALENCLWWYSFAKDIPAPLRKRSKRLIEEIRKQQNL